MRALVLLPLCVGCASAQLSTEVRDLRAQLARSERTRADLQAKVDDLDGRIFLLTDQVESQKVALARRGNPLAEVPSLPVVTLSPDAPEPELDPVPVPVPVPEPVPERAKQPQARRALHLEGHPRPPLPPPSPSDNLGVAKLPDKGIPVDAVAEKPQVEPLAAYRAAQARLQAGEHAAAASAFRDFVRRWPRHDYADNAQYWLAESFYARKDYAQAAPEFQTVVSRWPSGNKAPDALLKLAYCMIAVGSLADGRRTLAQVAAHYPHTDAAQLAARRLAELEPPK